MISKDKLDFCVKNNYNVLFIGKHGVGKSTIVIDTFNRHELKWQYFSASTMDPWVDFIGTPKEKIDENGQGYIDLIPPKTFKDDEVEALFFDELNRSHKKVRNAVMELIQFKSINGRKFKNLRFIWAAINPEEVDEGEDDYDVEKLDPAQKDRFHIVLNIPYEPDKKYFESKYGLNGLIAVEWWKEIPKNLNSKVSPRRLDYALEIYSNNGSIRDVIPEKNINVNKLQDSLKNGGVENTLNTLFKATPIDKDKIKSFINNDSNFNIIRNIISSSNQYMGFFLPYFHNEKFSMLFNSDNSVQDYVLKNIETYNSEIHTLIKFIYDNTQNSNLKLKINNIIKTNPKIKQILGIESVFDKYVNGNAKYLDVKKVATSGDKQIEQAISKFKQFIDDFEDDNNKAVLPSKDFLNYKTILTDNLSIKDIFDNYEKLLKFIAMLVARTRDEDLLSWKQQYILILNFILKEYFSYANEFNWFETDNHYYDYQDIKKTLKLLGLENECFIKN